MADFEQKLKNCYEYDPIEPREGFLEELKALEASPKRRRSVVLPFAAAAAAIMLIAVGWFWLHGAGTGVPKGPDVVQAEPGHSLAAEEQPTQQEPEVTPQPAEKPAVEPETPDAPEAEETDVRTPAEQETEATARPAVPTPAKPAGPIDSKPAEPADPESEDPVDLPQEVPEELKPDEPEKPNPDDQDDPAPDEPADPVHDEPNPVEPSADPPADDPEPPQDSPVGAVYQLKDGRETLTLTLMSTGESVELDVTGWESKPEPAPDEPPGPATYSGSNPIVNFLFEKSITYHLTRDDDGAVSVDLDVADTGN